MSAPLPERGSEPRPWYARTGLVFGALGLIVLATVLLTPTQGRTGDARLTTLSRQPQGARLFADLVARMGWRVERDSSVPTRGPLRADRVYAILDPPEQLTGREYSRLLDAVRRGAGLLVVHPGDGALADSLGIDRSSDGTRMRVTAAAARACPKDEKRFGINWPGGDVFSFWLVPKRPIGGDTVHFLPVMRPLTRDERVARGMSAEGSSEASPFADTGYVEPSSEPQQAEADDDVDTSAADTTADSIGVKDTTSDTSSDTTSNETASADISGDFAYHQAISGATTARDSARLRRARDRALRNARLPAPAAIGIPLGKGRVVLLADADWLRNDVMRVCRWNAGVTSIRMLEWLTANGAPRHLVVDEWHQGRGIHASAAGALGRFVTRDPRGRMLAQGVLASLLLLAALGARPLVPAAGGRIERRSPFEHIGALARAYEEIGATRVVTRRLVRGLRRRLGSVGNARDEEALLAALESRHPALAPQLALVREALVRAQSPARLLDVGRAIADIERTVVRT